MPIDNGVGDEMPGLQTPACYCRGGRAPLASVFTA